MIVHALTVRNNIVRHCLGAPAKRETNWRVDRSVGPMLDDPCDDREEAELKSERSRRDAGGECLRLAPLFPTTGFYVCVENVITFTTKLGIQDRIARGKDRGNLELRFAEFCEKLKKRKLKNYRD